MEGRNYRIGVMRRRYEVNVVNALVLKLEEDIRKALDGNRFAEL